MDRWRSGTPETCHSSHHHAVCTRSASLSLSLQVFFSSSSSSSSYDISLSFHPSIQSFIIPQSPSYFQISSLHPLVCRQLRKTICPSFSSRHLSFFFLLLPLSLPSSSLAVVFRFHHLLWRHSSFLLSIFSPLPPSLFLFRSHSFFFLPIFTFCAEKKSLVLFFSLLRLSLMDQRKKVWIEGWRGIMCGDKRRMRRIRKGGIV